jgi:hypothetical protein
MKTDLFNFDLPADHIALRPAIPRDSARLLVVKPGEAPELADRSIGDRRISCGPATAWWSMTARSSRRG